MSPESISHFRPSPTSRVAGFGAPLVAAGAAVLATWAGGFVASGGAAPAHVGWLTGACGVAALVSGSCVAWVMRAARTTSARATGGKNTAGLFDNSAGTADGTGARLLARQVVPVWQRQLEASHAEAEQGLAGLLQSFNDLSAGLGEAIAAAGRGQGQLGAGTADAIVEQRKDLLESMLVPVQSLRAFRGEVQAELQRLAELLVAFRRMGKDFHALGRHARLVAMNASIEANRAGHNQGGFGAVAREVLALADETAGSAERLSQRLGEAEQRLGALRGRLELDTGNAETLALELQQQARAVVTAIVGDLGGALAGSHELRQTSQRLQASLDGVFVGFQFQDRFAQMLGSVLADMKRFEQWLGEGRGASHADAVAWLKRLDDSYTMEQQRSRHHGTEHIGTGTAVEFF